MTGIKILNLINFIEGSRKEHVCCSCKKAISKKQSYFIFNKVVQESGKQSYPISKEWPRKVCYTCYPKQRLIFRGREDDVLQMQLGI